MEEEPKEIMSMVPFEKLLDEVNKLQGDRPALVILYDGVGQMFFLKHNLTFKDPIVDKMVQMLSMNVLQARGFDLEKVEEMIKNKNDKQDGK